jgi:guanine nucleotide-binding protein subunit alpha
MSGFNQVLAEDESVNRLVPTFPVLWEDPLTLFQTDSLRLWQLICSNKILAEVEFVLFLNKLDILDAKLKSGIQFSSFVTSYKNKPNETKPVARCMYPLSSFPRYSLTSLALKISWTSSRRFIKNILRSGDDYIHI